jgi:hypothetical protein
MNLVARITLQSWLAQLAYIKVTSARMRLSMILVALALIQASAAAIGVQRIVYRTISKWFVSVRFGSHEYERKQQPLRRGTVH